MVAAAASTEAGSAAAEFSAGCLRAWAAGAVRCDWLGFPSRLAVSGCGHD